MDETNELMHVGVKGMKWGVRKDRPSGASPKVDRAARRDANEHSKAKMFYGEGAGNRRKLIKAKVDQKSKDPEYKKAFDFHIENQDMSKRASQAKTTRKVKDVQKGTAKTARGVKNLAMKTGAPVAVSSVAVYAAYQNPTVRATVNRHAKTTYRTVKNTIFRG